MSRDTSPPRAAKDQMMLMLGCGGLVLAIALAVAVITLAWRL